MVNAHEDKARRSRLAILLGVCIALALFLVRQPSIGGVPGFYLSTSVLLGAFALGWWSGLFRRAHAVLRISSIRRDGLAATTMLNAGDFAGAREAFAKLLFTARPLGAFHAVHVLMYGVTRFFEGETREGLALASRAIDSGWLDLRHTREVRDAAEAWRVLMLLDSGDLAAARRKVDSGAKLGTAAITVRFEEAGRALGDQQFPKQGRPTVAVLGLFAAKKLGRDGGDFKTCLEKEPLGPLALKNPVLKKFL